MNIRTTSRRLGVVAAASGMLVLGLAGAASAHVTVTPSSTAAGSYTLLTFAVPHGCDGSATTKITISMPDDIIEATPTRNAFYDVAKTTKKLDTPITAEDGDEITEKVDTVVFTAKTPLPDGYRDAFSVQVQLPNEAGKELSFPTIQECEQGQTAWTEIPADGQDPESLDHPAPSFAITPAEDAPASSAAASDGSSEAAAPTVTASSPSDDDSNEDSGDGWGYAGVALGLLGAVLGGAALARTRRKA